MSNHDSDKAFTGSTPEIYETHLVPLIFEPYAADLAARLAARPLKDVLEIAAGTGVVTRAMANTLPASVSIVATDLNQAMLDRAAARGTKREVTWSQADAMELPFGDGNFGAVVCQFGVMFFPDKAAAFAETRRVLKPGGLFLFNVWDRIQENEFADTITNALEKFFPDGSATFPRADTSRLSRSCNHQTRSRRGWIHCITGSHNSAGLQPGRVVRDSRRRLLPWNTVTKRD